MSKSVKLIENFISWQGEGIDSGRPMIILRFKTCNLKCPWCDTSVKMRISAEAPHLLSDIQDTIYRTNAGLLITGGEPTVPKHFDEAALLLNELDYPIANVESNGYKLFQLIQEVSPDKHVRYVYSPKIFNDSDLSSALQNVKLLESFPEVYIKVVYDDSPLIEKFLANISANYKNLSWNHRVWVMPEGTTRVDLIKNSAAVFDICEKYGFSFSSRDHIIYGFV
jgi:organic radical activating enzyme